ncbi:hypothetical protein [Streptomyces sp. NBC_00576]|uniref:hypothetical protein n=1 Tax=Streptomyces sp. NBC_00576 TaxID=2903665 RepID=UPI002E822F58|nr:hypothetical protein [Streptomyces sp. NBC_00576]WUB69556.1 hypothetical protein OG734_05470 [Streptomyces sp. NBC_00576]
MPTSTATMNATAHNREDHTGKSTCAALLQRYWDPAADTVTIGGHDLRDLPSAQLQRLIAAVPQDA